MASFLSSQDPNFLLDPTSINFLRNNTPLIKEDNNNNNYNTMLSPFFNELNYINNTMSQFYSPQTLLPSNSSLINYYDNEVIFTSTTTISSPLVSSSCLETNMNSPVMKQSNNNTESSTVLESGEQVTQKVTPNNRKRKTKTGSSLDSSNSMGDEDKEGKSKKQKKGNSNNNNNEKKKANNKEQEEPPTGYIHVRARRGQATDSHSLAERVRREKISERMKILQKLVPGCDKVTGKALMLDEIINYVQSLQNQIEFLSMRLASINPLLYEFGLDEDVSFMVRPTEGLSHLASPLPPVTQCSPTQHQPTALADAATTTTSTATTRRAPNFELINNYNYHLVDNSSSILLQGQRPISINDLTQDGVSLLWDIDEQRQKFVNLSWLGNNNNNLCSFFPLN